MVTRKLCVEVLDLVLTSFQTSFVSAPTVSKVQITDMLLLSTSFFSYPLPRSHRRGGFEKKMVSIHKLFLSFPNKGGCSHMSRIFERICETSAGCWGAVVVKSETCQAYRWCVRGTKGLFPGKTREVRSDSRWGPLWSLAKWSDMGVPMIGWNLLPREFLFICGHL